MDQKMKRFLITLLALPLAFSNANAMCGCMFGPPPPQIVAQNQSVAKLYNKSSQVVLVRDGLKTTITMSNDVYGDVKDFAMVVPVPAVLRRDQIRTVNMELLNQLEQRTGPRLTTITDPNPCQTWGWDAVTISEAQTKSTIASSPDGTRPQSTQSTVKVEARYAVGEYDILILSAQESEGLMTWLKTNGYQVSESAREVLEPYIKSGLKFFVAKVNLERKPESEGNFLTPLQISFETERFMLPIRLGMANADGDQDLTVYAFTRTGRVEPTNYRMAEMPTNLTVPTFVAQDFGKFYSDMFTTAWKREGRNAIMLEFAGSWIPNNWSPWQNDNFNQFKSLGLDWVQDENSQTYSPIMLTRMHIRYNRTTFPQDLAFQVTPNNQQYNCNISVQEVATGFENCEQGKAYANQVAQRRERELITMNQYAGWSMNKYAGYPYEHMKGMKTPKGNESNGKKGFLPVIIPNSPKGPGAGLGILWLAGLGLIVLAFGARTFILKKA